MKKAQRALASSLLPHGITQRMSHELEKAYGTTAYWNDRYTDDPDPFDWYQTYAGVKSILSKHLTKKGRVLMAGAGNSTLSEGTVKYVTTIPSF